MSGSPTADTAAGVAVAYCCYSEQVLLKADEIKIVEMCQPRQDGWIHSKRLDMPTQRYLLLPGN